MWERIRERIECGLTWDVINQKQGVNCNKFLAYRGLSTSSTDPWPEFNLDEVVVIDEFEATVTDRMMKINEDYSYEIGEQTVSIDHTDGCGMMLPSVSKKNFMIRGPYCKGLLVSFDWLRFCNEKGVPAIVTDVWGKEWDLEKSGIKIIMFKSMMKMYKYYDSFDHYKKCVRECGAQFGKMNYEEDEVDDSTFSYQMLQSLTDFTDKEVAKFTKKEHDRIVGISKDKNSMLKALKADSESPNPYKAALAYYPELLREAYTKNQLKDTRKRMLLDAKSGRIRIRNKRLFVIPDLYAACEYVFQHIEHPNGLLKKDEVACKPLRNYDKADVLRSPHLSMEHHVAKIVHDDYIYSWFYTNAIVTSVHSLASRILQFDVDGDQLNVVVEPLIVEIAERNLKKFDVVPLFYDAEKADPEPLSNEAIYKGLKRAHDFSCGEVSIGEISNMLTRVWNKDKPDRIVAALLCRLNNASIDAAKCGRLNHYNKYPEVARRVSKAVGGNSKRMPAWFRWTLNRRGEKKKREYLKPNNSTMNRICAAFNDIGNVNLNGAKVPPFNYEMLLSAPCDSMDYGPCDLFTDMDSINISAIIESQDVEYVPERETTAKYELLADMIREELIERYGSLEKVYPYIVKFLFTGKNMDKVAHKQMFWRVFGEIALNNIKANLANYRICTNCGMKYPHWQDEHVCPKDIQGIYRCIDCGSICQRINSSQRRCKNCQEVYDRTYARDKQRKKRAKRKEDEERRSGFLGSYLKSISLTEVSGHPSSCAEHMSHQEPEQATES